MSAADRQRVRGSAVPAQLGGRCPLPCLQVTHCLQNRDKTTLTYKPLLGHLYSKMPRYFLQLMFLFKNNKTQLLLQAPIKTTIQHLAAALPCLHRARPGISREFTHCSWEPWIKKERYVNSRSLCSLPFQPLADLHLPPAQQAASLLQTPSACVWPEALTHKPEFTTLPPAPSCFSQLLGECYSLQTSPPACQSASL